MKNFAVISIKLGLICAVAALFLGLVNSVTAPRIAFIKEQRLNEALEIVSMGYSVGSYIDETSSEVIDGRYPLGENGSAGYLLRLNAKGYGGEMVLLASYSRTGEILSVKLMENLETPGLGKEAEKEEYMEKFIGTGNITPVPVRKNMLSQSEADAISGATITFAGIADALAEGSEYIKGLKE